MGPLFSSMIFFSLYNLYASGFNPPLRLMDFSETSIFSIEGIPLLEFFSISTRTSWVYNEVLFCGSGFDINAMFFLLKIIELISEIFHNSFLINILTKNKSYESALRN